MNLLIIRGIPGSGKSTYAHKVALNTGAVVLERDQFRIHDGEYTFTLEDTAKIQSALLSVVRTYAEFGVDIIVVGVLPTIKSVNEIVEVVDKARPKEEDLYIKVKICKHSFRNTHNVPQDVIDSMEKSFENCPSNWEVVE